jgi:ectoine hydroxylase-related dioxygenase (phytanoyl-CoA dioxygenase family)
MISAPSAKRYGVKVQTHSGGPIEQAAEKIKLVGYATVESGYTSDQRNLLAEAFNRTHGLQANTHGGPARLAEIDEHHTIRAPLSLDAAFLELAQNKNVLGVAEQLFCGTVTSGAFVLNQQNGIINPGNSGAYNQGAFHRDLPYQHFVSSRPLAINALYCIEPFTRENGATFVIPGSHKEEAFPSDHTVNALSLQVEAPAGHYLILDCMLFHSGGVNRTGNPRRAVNHVYTLPFIRQQIELPSLMGPSPNLPPETMRLLGYGIESVRSVGTYYESRISKKSASA